MKLDPYYNPESEHYFSGKGSDSVTGVRRVCSTQSEVRVYSNSTERWHYLSCPIVTQKMISLAELYQPKGWLERQTENVMEGLSRIARAKWVDESSYIKVIEELRNGNSLVPKGFTYKRAIK